MYEVLEHTADIGLRIRADDLGSLLADAARGLFSLIVANLDDVRPLESQRIQLRGAADEYLLFDWLAELLFLFETRRMLFSEFAVQVTDQGIDAVCRGEPLDDQRHRLDHEVKAITYHGLTLVAGRDGWMAEVILDI